MKVLAHLLATDGAIPNHPRWPLLVALSTISGVPLPACDPVFGPGGPLFEHWK